MTPNNIIEVEDDEVFGLISMMRNALLAISCRARTPSEQGPAMSARPTFKRLSRATVRFSVGGGAATRQNRK
jgi:hypothetical protein